MATAEEAAAKIQREIERLEAEREMMKAANAALVRGDDDALRALGISESTIAILKTTDRGHVGYPDFALKMNAQKIGELKRRLKRLEAGD